MTDSLSFVANAKQHLSAILDRSGNVLYSSIDTLRPGPVYLLALNPGGDPNDSKHRQQTIRSALEQLPSKRENEFLDVSWRDRGVRREAGESILQRRVRRLTELLGLDLRSICAANLIFARAVDAQSSEFHRLAPTCWPVHRMILDIVQPRLVLSLGNGELSAYAFIRHQLRGGVEESIPSGHGDWECRSFRTAGMTIVGLPHLSRYAAHKNPSVIEWLRGKLAA